MNATAVLEDAVPMRLERSFSRGFINMALLTELRKDDAEGQADVFGETLRLRLASTRQANTATETRLRLASAR